MDYIRARLKGMRVELEKEERNLIVSPFESFVRERDIIEGRRNGPVDEGEEIRPLGDDLCRSSHREEEEEEEEEYSLGPWNHEDDPDRDPPILKSLLRGTETTRTRTFHGHGRQSPHRNR